MSCIAFVVELIKQFQLSQNKRNDGEKFKLKIFTTSHLIYIVVRDQGISVKLVTTSAKKKRCKNVVTSLKVALSTLNCLLLLTSHYDASLILHLFPLGLVSPCSK